MSISFTYCATRLYSIENSTTKVFASGSSTYNVYGLVMQEILRQNVYQ